MNFITIEKREESPKRWRRVLVTFRGGAHLTETLQYAPQKIGGSQVICLHGWTSDKGAGLQRSFLRAWDHQTSSF